MKAQRRLRFSSFSSTPTTQWLKSFRLFTTVGNNRKSRGHNQRFTSTLAMHASAMGRNESKTRTLSLIDRECWLLSFKANFLLSCKSYEGMRNARNKNQHHKEQVFFFASFNHVDASTQMYSEHCGKAKTIRSMKDLLQTWLYSPGKFSDSLSCDNFLWHYWHKNRTLKKRANVEFYARASKNYHRKSSLRFSNANPICDRFSSDSLWNSLWFNFHISLQEKPWISTVFSLCMERKSNTW